MGALAQDAQPHCSSLLMPWPWPAHQVARDSLQAMALGLCEVHVAAQGTVEVVQGFFCHLHLPLGHEDTLARVASEGLAIASRRTPPCLTCPNLAPDIPDSIPLSLSPGHCLDPAIVLLSGSKSPLLTAPPASTHTAQIWLSEVQLRETDAQRGAVISAGSQSKDHKPAPACQARGRALGQAGKAHRVKPLGKLLFT